MFEFSRDLRRLFEKARDSADLGWLEVISTSLVENEARHQSLESSRLSCGQPFHACLRASLLWREHARRTGNAQSLNHCEAEARAAIRHAANEDQTIRAAIELSQAKLLTFDLIGGPERLDAADDLLTPLPAPRRASLADALGATQARIAARRARLNPSTKAIELACQGLEAAVQSLKGQDSHSDIELRIEQASLSLEIGLMTRDLSRVDKAGQDLKALVQEAPVDQKPITRGRALALCGIGMLALADIAKDEVARQQGFSLLKASSDQFTMDHSPLDWAIIQLMRSEADDKLPLITLVQVEALTEDHGLIIGAEARERRMALEICEAEHCRDLVGLKHLEARILTRLRVRPPVPAPLNWVSHQIGLARIFLAHNRLTGETRRDIGLILIEAAETARELGAISLAERAQSLLPYPQTI